MKPSVEQVGNLLSLQRHVRPEEGYWQDFLCEFHYRQRVQAVRKTGFLSWIQAFFSGLQDMGAAKWAYGVGIAYAVITVAFFLIPKSPEAEQLPLSPVSYEIPESPQVPATEQLEEMDLSPAARGQAGDQAF